MTVADWESSHALIDEDYEEMANFGITRGAVDYFYYKEFRYTQLADAVAEAKRDESRERLRQGDLRAEARFDKETIMTPEERTVRQKQLNVWREARRASLSFPHGREMTREQMNEQARLEGEQENARLALHDLDAARALRDTHDELRSCADPRAVNRDQMAGGRDILLEALRAAQKASLAAQRGRATTDGEMEKLNRLHAEEDKACRALKAFDVAS